MKKTREQITEEYRRRVDQHAAEERASRRIDRRLSKLRLTAFIVMAIGFVSGWRSDDSTAGYTVGGIGLAALLALMIYHEQIVTRIRQSRALRRIYQQSLARMERLWGDVPVATVEVPESAAALALDLDLFGSNSLFHLACQAHTAVGQDTLRDWFLHPAPPAEIADRQAAVAALRDHEQLREALTLRGALLVEGRGGLNRFLEWSESKPWLIARPWLLWSIRATPCVWLATFVLAFIGILPPAIGGWTLLGLLGLHALVSIVLTARVHDLFNSVWRGHGEIRRYVELFDLMYSIPESGDKLKSIKAEATLSDRSALKHLHQLGWIMWLARLSHDGMAYLLYLVLQLILLWDFQVLAYLERWQVRYGSYARRWFVALGEFEALNSLAALAHDNPDWVFPHVDTSLDRLQAEQLGHPLLAEGERVCNDVTVGPAGTVLLVTGSNMSGKSTLLRSIGSNIVLAQAGAPVCATSFELPPVAIATSMRIRDSLADHVSFYMAELRRLKQIVDDAQQSTTDRRLFYLLDEILQGTNSTERHIAVVRVLSHLLASPTIGAISTHDLSLASSDELADSCEPVHFRETLHDDAAEQPMTFDYELRPGVATTTNALKLLELIGLGGRDGKKHP